MLQKLLRAAASDDVDTLLSWQLAGVTFADKEWLGQTPMKAVCCFGVLSHPLTLVTLKAVANNAQKAIQFLTNTSL